MVSPSEPNILGQVQVRPQFDQHVNVDEVANVIVGALGEDDLIDLETLSAIVQVPGESRTAPADAGGQRNDAVRLLDNLLVDVVR